MKHFIIVIIDLLSFNVVIAQSSGQKAENDLLNSLVGNWQMGRICQL